MMRWVRPLGSILLLGACPAPRSPPVTAADSLLLLRSTAQVAQTCLKVVALRDTLDQERQQRRVQAAARLAQHVVDSLREVRWTSPR